MDLRAELEQHLGAAYTLGRELGGGGMSRVFVAEDTRLRRQVVIKVLSPELAQGLNVDRFEREIQLAASLQQANIVPLHSAGDVGGLPYFTMPFIEGESLRARLGRGPLAIGEVVATLRDVTRALAYAHARGVVHRDIKPDNVLLSGGTAVVTDFGIAKAITASRTDADSGTLTQLGTSIGTPAYMAPEQVVGDPHLDQRVDLYALGCMAFELLTGQQPFGDRPTPRMLAAHLTETAPAVTSLRPDCPPDLAALVARMMAKDPAQRPQAAVELLPVLDSAVTTSGTAVAFSGPGMFRKALGWYALALVAVAIVAKAAVVGIGLPDWVFPGAILVMALGLPALLATAYVQRIARQTATATPTRTPGGTAVARQPSGTVATMALKASPHLTWKRTTRGGYIMIGGFGALVALFMALRGLGIGPWGSLFAAGKLAEHSRIVVADFAAPPGDSALGPILVEAVRASLGQSRSVQLMEPAEVAAVLTQMRRSRDARLDPALARDVAIRAGAQAVGGGRLARVGTGYAVSLDLTAAQDGASLASFQGTADGPKDLLKVVDDLTRRLRERMGESLRQVRRAVPLEQATTASLPALQKYSEAVHANDVDADYPRAIRAAREAVALDSTFALAWRKLGVALGNQLAPAAAVDSAMANAVRYADRLPDRERYLVTGAWYEHAGSAADRGKALAAYQAAYAADSTSTVAANEMSLIYAARRQFDSATRYAERLDRLRPGTIPATLVGANLAAAGYADSGAAIIRAALARNAGDPPDVNRWYSETVLYSLEGRSDSLRVAAQQLWSHSSGRIRSFGAFGLYAAATVHGRLTEAREHAADAAFVLALAGDQPGLRGITPALFDIVFRDRAAQGAARLDSVLAGHEWAASTDRPWLAVATLYAWAGRPARAREVLSLGQAEPHSLLAAPDSAPEVARVNAEIALADGKYADAIRQFRAADTALDGAPSLCGACTAYDLARAYDRAGDADSALSWYNRYLAIPPFRRLPIDAYALAAVQKRLGELYDARHDRQHAIEHYAAFVDLWKNADPDLQPVVQTVRKRLAELSSN